MWDCTAFAKDATLQAGCWQAEAASHAAKLGLQGATRGGAATVVAGILALGAGAFVLFAARLQVAYGRQEIRENTAAALIGDISAWHAFIKDEDVIGTLNVKAANSEAMYFHPGDHWLQVYFSDPSKSGFFPQKIAEDLAYYYSRMSGEIGRLIWLHELARAGKQQESWIPREQKNCAASLNKLRTKGEDLICRLDDERKEALKARRSWFSLVFKPG